MTPTTKKIIGAILGGIVTAIGTLGAGEAKVIDAQLANTIIAIISAILTGGMFVPTKPKV
jgi:hypothetical protein